MDQAGPERDGVAFVARERELQRVLAAISGPKPAALVIAGPAGVGKTRLVSEAAGSRPLDG